MEKSTAAKKKRKFEDNGFAEWGGYMNAKIMKLEEQFQEDSSNINSSEKLSNIFEGVAIFVNGFTEPTAEELRVTMLLNGGSYHHYHRKDKTTHVIATNLPNAKMAQLKSMKVVKPEWITESITAGKLLDYKNFLLFTHSTLQDGIQKQLISADVRDPQPKQDASPVKSSMTSAKTAVDGEFLSEFYVNSRLHHLSTMGAFFKQYVKELIEKHDGKFPGRERLSKWKNDENPPETEDIPSEKVVMHIDMDCFFVSVALKNFPELKGQPVAVTHAKGNNNTSRPGVDREFEYNFYKKKMESKIGDNPDEGEGQSHKKKWSEESNSMSEIASCSYEARKAGVRNGMYLGSALKLCPNLQTVPYDFEGYKEVSYALYNTISEYTLDVEAVSIDELFIDCDKLLASVKVSPLDFSKFLRQEIRERTGCPSSVGIGANKLQARLATKRAKPDGQYYVTPMSLPDFLTDISVSDLPGVGRTLNYRLKSMNLRTCEDLQRLSLDVLKKEFGGKTGETLYKSCRGIDDRSLNTFHVRKSVSAEVNYGIRFNNDDEATTFFGQLSKEVSNRLKEIQMKGKSITLKLMVRAKDAPVETAKFLGHGACDNLTRSISLTVAMDDPLIILKHVLSIYKKLSVAPNDLRGIGIQITKLETSKKGAVTLQDFFKDKHIGEISKKSSDKLVKTNDKIQVPVHSQLDKEVLDSLPDDLRREILKEYGTVHKASSSDAVCVSKVAKNMEGNTASGSFTIEIKEDAEEQFNDNACNRMTVQEIRNMIKEWVKSEVNPQKCDADMLAEYVKDLINNKRLECCEKILKCFKRHVSDLRSNSDVWMKTYSDVVNEIQVDMLKMFGKSLAVDGYS